jgi:hypothetical protein
MIITRISSGLGNQLFQYAVSRAISMKSGIELKLDISFYETDKLRAYLLNRFKIVETLAKDDEIKTFKTEEAIRKKNIKRIINRFGTSGIEKVGKHHIKEKPLVSFAPGVLNLKDNFYLEGYWQNELYFKSIRKTILKEFTLKHPLGDQANKFLEKVRNCNSVSVHVRRGDYNNNLIFGTLPPDYYIKAVEFIKNLVSFPIFFVFSDDISWTRRNFIQAENITFVDLNGPEKDIQDLELMKNCYHNIIANSTFSWWGAWLNENQNKIVIAPRTWSNSKKFQKSQDKYEFIPREWITI